MPNLSVIIPTHKRPDTLKRCLGHLEAQENVEEIEVIVVSDGHNSATAELMENGKWKMENKIKFFEIKKSQQGVARNRGIREAKSPICLIIGDDIFLAPDACKKHLDEHRRLSTFDFRPAVLGFTTWDPNLQITPVMKWLEKSGWQFGYTMIEKYAHQKIPKEIQHRFTYTSHISIPTDIALKYPFKEDIILYGWEDIEWGERLKKAGIPLYYNSEAKALHHHKITMKDSLKRMKTLGKSISSFPNSERYPPKWKIMIYKLQALLPTMTGRHRKAFLQGMRK
ncbi:MAG: glycosyltransferase family 2 protein [Candidatus Peribacteraceae bacterium]|nr:glycosyltransferase family 2 protein [Candidatus Peribacteraceae bacterium]